MANMNWIIKSNYQVHGLEWTVKWAAKKGINPDTVCFALTGKYLRPMR